MKLKIVAKSNNPIDTEIYINDAKQNWITGVSIDFRATEPHRVVIIGHPENIEIDMDGIEPDDLQVLKLK